MLFFKIIFYTKDKLQVINKPAVTTTMVVGDIVQLWVVIKIDWHVSYSAPYQWRHYLLTRGLILVISLNFDPYHPRFVHNVLNVAAILTNDLCCKGENFGSWYYGFLSTCCITKNGLSCQAIKMINFGF